MYPHHLLSRIQQKIFFVDKSIDIFEGAPIRLNFYMVGHIFENIIAALSFTDILLLSFKDKLFEVHHMVDAWNQHMKDVFIPLWVYCLYYSIYIWTNKFTCPLWMFFPRKPHHKGNEYHTIWEMGNGETVLCGERSIKYSF